MIFSILQKDLFRALQHVCLAVDKKQTLPVLSNILITAKEGILTLCTTDLEVELVGKIDTAIITDDGITTVSSRKLFDICRSLSNHANELIYFELVENNLFVKQSRSRFSLATIEADQFPKLQEITMLENGFSIQYQTLSKMIKNTKFSMGEEDVRFHFNGILLELDRHQITVVATDGHRLSLCKHSDSQFNFDYKKTIIPRKAVTEIVRLFHDTDEVQVTITDNHLYIKKEDLSFTTKLIDSVFPDYNAVVPDSEITNLISVSRKSFRNVLSRVSLLSEDIISIVSLTFSNNLLMLESNNIEWEHAEEKMDIEFTGQPFTTVFNVFYLIEILNILKEETIDLEFYDNNGIIVIRSENPTSLYVVMSMRT